MAGAKRGFGMPLLGKELREQAARKGTYVARVVYAVLLFSAFLIGTDWLWSGRFDALGRGSEMLWILVVLQFCGIYLFLPAMMSRTIAEEKEKETLVLLFLTDMGPWELLLQKYLGRLIPMFCFLLLSLPLMAIAYAYGGISAAMLGVSVWMVFLCCLQTGAFALMCSAYCRTPGGALLASYIGLAVFYGVPGAVVLLCPKLGGLVAYFLTDVSRNFPPMLWLEVFDDPAAGVSLATIRVIGTAGSFLLVARILLTRHASRLSRNPMLAVFGALDRVFGRWNAKMGGFAMWKGRQALPVDEPVAWREQQKRGIGRPHHLCRLGLLIMIPTVLIGMGSAAPRGWVNTLALFIGWLLAGFSMAVQAASMIAAERSRQTMEVLLATPIAAREIVRQKMCALRRFGVLLAVPLLTLAGFELLSRSVRPKGQWLYVVSCLIAVPLFLSLMAWGGMWIGMRVKTRGRAFAVVLMALVVWCAVPVLSAVVNLYRSGWRWSLAVSVISPAVIPLMLESVLRERNVLETLVAVAVALVGGYGILTWRLRWWCLENAERIFRSEQPVRRSVVDWLWWIGGVGLLGCAARLVGVSGAGCELINLLLTFGWPLVGMGLAVKGMEAIADVRACQSRENMSLTTPIAAREFVRQAMRDVLRLAAYWAVPLCVSAYICAFLWRTFGFIDSGLLWIYALCCLTAVPLSFALLAWCGVLIGLRVRSRVRVVVVMLVTSMFAVYHVVLLNLVRFWLPTSRQDGVAVGIVVGLVACYGILTWHVRRLCLENAERLLKG